jgi:hypothetical protein
MKFKLFLLIAVLALLSVHVFATPGTLDPTFGGGYFVTDVQQTGSPPFTQMAIQPNGKILVAANVGQALAAQITLYRFNADATPDISLKAKVFSMICGAAAAW